MVQITNTLNCNTVENSYGIKEERGKYNLGEAATNFPFYPSNCNDI